MYDQSAVKKQESEMQYDGNDSYCLQSDYSQHLPSVFNDSVTATGAKSTRRSTGWSNATGSVMEG